MKVLLTGATGYIGRRLLPLLLDEGHQVVCCVRDKNRFDASWYSGDKLAIIELDFLKPASLNVIPQDVDIAYYLIHSMSSTTKNFDDLEERSATNFKEILETTKVRQVIYLSGITNQDNLSKHLSSRKQVEETLGSDKYHLTTLRAGIIIGSGSASFEIMRDLVEKLPVMITPKWLNTRSQPIAIRNVLEFLKGVMNYEYTFNKSFDIGGTEILTYKEMLLEFGKVRKLKRYIFTLPVMTPRLSSYWLYFVTATSYNLAINLVDSMKVEVICQANDLAERLNIKLISYKDAIRLAFDKIAQHDVASSWTDAQSSSILSNGITELGKVPTNGCFKDSYHEEAKNPDLALERIWSIGGENGWYAANWLWAIRGYIDKLVGGVGLRRGRKHQTEISAGESLDFWRVLYANKSEKRLLLYAEMKLPGEAWLEFIIKDGKVFQTATFRPLGLLGRLYWYSVLPFHALIFRGMLRKIVA